jgi:hypothetical protein
MKGKYPDDAKCLVTPCDRKIVAKGLCKLHYYRLRNTGELGPAHVTVRIPPPNEDAAGRLLAMTDRSGGMDACWPWRGSTIGMGYGMFSVKKRRELAHRWAWMVANGQEIPDGLMVRHTCDNPPCCNPSHLLLGTHTDNMHDRRDRGRAPDLRGENSGSAKLTEAQVIAMRELHAQGIGSTEIGRLFGISQSHASGIVLRRFWKHIA